MKIVCRCGDVTEKEIVEAIAEGYVDIESLRRYTGLGGGPCQGKYCIVNLMRILADLKAVEGGKIPVPTPRPPIMPLRIGLLAKSRLDSMEVPEDLDRSA